MLNQISEFLYLFLVTRFPFTFPTSISLKLPIFHDSAQLSPLWNLPGSTKVRSMQGSHCFPSTWHTLGLKMSINHSYIDSTLRRILISVHKGFGNHIIKASMQETSYQWALTGHLIHVLQNTAWDLDLQTLNTSWVVFWI